MAIDVSETMLEHLGAFLMVLHMNIENKDRRIPDKK
jgi:hypothetical protein